MARNNSASTGSSTQTGGSSTPTGSSSSQPQTGSLLLANITNLVSVKLDGDNYLLWLSRFEPLLYSNDLYALVDGTDLCPNKFIPDSDGKPTTTVNPAYLSRRKRDQMLVGWIKATFYSFSERVLAQVVRIEHLFRRLEVSGAIACNSISLTKRDIQCY